MIATLRIVILRFSAPMAFVLTPLFAGPTVSVTEPEQSALIPALTTIKITFSEPVSGVDPADLVINAQSAARVTGTGAGPYEFSFTQPVPGDVSVSWDFDHGIAGTAGSGAFVPEGGWTYNLMDTLAPTIGKVREGHDLDAIVPLPGAKVDSLTQVEVRFSEVVEGVDAADLLVNDVGVTEMQGEGAGPYIFAFPQPEPGEIEFSWVEDPGIVDPAGNRFEPQPWEVTLAPGGRGSLQITEFMAANATVLLDNDDESPDWIEIYNPGPETVNLAGWSLTTDPERPDMWVIPSRSIPADRRLVVFASAKDSNSPFGKPHTNFTLDLAGGYLALFSPESPRQEVSAFVDYPAQRIDFSYGVTTSGEKRYFAEPTPEQANQASGLTEVTPQPDVSVGRGFFAEPFTLIISSSDPTATIRYTLNGSEPLLDSTEYTAPLEISSTTILRAAAFASDKVSSATVTHSYIYLDEVLSQPSPPYDNPDRQNDNDNPPLPKVGDATFPIVWGSQSGAGFPGEIDNLPANAAPADYGMDPEIIDDPNKYDDNGEIDNVNGITNRERIERAFRELPLMSIVLNNDDMFGPQGLHPNSLQKGDRFEKPCSVELLLADGTTGFDTTCGIRLHGNASREPRKCPKHGFKLNFKSTFGASRLSYALFPDSPSREFDDIILRGDFNSSWLHWSGTEQRPRGTRMRDAFCKDTFRDMGRAAGHHIYVHLFINGLYWGLYDPTEQENNGFAANTFGGSKDDYDVVEQGQLKSGSQSTYDKMRAISSPITNERFEEMKQYLDVPWYADYMLLHFFVGHQDWGDNVDKNWYAVRHQDGGMFRYLPWDMENLMWDENVNRVTVSSPPTGLHTKLVSNDQYLLDFADRVHKHLVAPDGALRPEANIARWNKWRAVIQNAIACEAARWGDYRRDVHRHESGPYPLFTWTDQWMIEQNRLTETYFPDRPEIVLRQLRDRGLYPRTDAPQFKDASNALVGSQRVAPGFELGMSKPSIFSGGDIYFTTDGADPRVYFDTTGEITPTAQKYMNPITLNESTVVRARTLQNGTWSALMEASFKIGSPATGVRITEIHYNARGSLGGSAAEFIEIQNSSDLVVDLSAWSFRGVDFVFPWGSTLGPGNYMVIASNDAPNIFHAQHPGVSVVGYYRGNLDNSGERLTLLDGDGNLVAGMEFSDQAPWAAAADNGGPSLEVIDPNGDLQSPFNWRASARTNGSPGVPNSVAPVQSLRISEFHAKSGSVESDFVEILNTTNVSVDLTGWSVKTRAAEEEVFFEAGTMLDPGDFLVVDITLPSSWGEVALTDAGGNTVDGVRYGSQAEGFSFNRLEGGWQLGMQTPGATNEAASTGVLTDLRLNEWLANPHPGFDDWLEIVNTNATQPVVLTGLHVAADGERHVIASPSVVPPGGVIRLFNDRGARRADALLFQLPATGATLTLGDAEGDVFDTITYGPQIEGASEGRIPDGTGDVVPLDYPSPGVPNEVEAAGAVQLNEVRLGRDGWIELLANESVDLSGWQIRTVSHSSSGWTIPSGLSLDEGSYVTVATDAEAAASSEMEENLNSALPIDETYTHWGIELVNPLGQAVDRVTWGLQLPNRTIGRLPGGESWALLAEMTPGAPNSDMAALGETSSLRINEWFTSGGDTAPPIERSFVELYNPGQAPVALGGLWLGDEPSEVGRRKWRIPSLTFVDAHGFAVFFSGQGESQPNRFLFDLARGGEYLRLGAGDQGKIQLEALSFGRSPSDRESRGRLPDGGETLSSLAPTPGAPNSNEAPPNYIQWAAAHGITDPNGDDDRDGLRNFFEYLSGTDPHTPSTPAEREATRRIVRVEEVGGQRSISVELNVDSNAIYGELLGELSPDLQVPWTAVPPSSVEDLGQTPAGLRKMRFQFPVPANEPIHFLRLRIEP